MNQHHICSESRKSQKRQFRVHPQIMSLVFYCRTYQYVLMYEIKHQTISFWDNMVLHFNNSLEQLHKCCSSNNCASSRVISGHASHMRCRKKKSRPNWITASIACDISTSVGHNHSASQRCVALVGGWGFWMLEIFRFLQLDVSWYTNGRLRVLAKSFAQVLKQKLLRFNAWGFQILWILNRFFDITIECSNLDPASWQLTICTLWKVSALHLMTFREIISSTWKYMSGCYDSLDTTHILYIYYNVIWVLG